MKIEDIKDELEFTEQEELFDVTYEAHRNLLKSDRVERKRKNSKKTNINNSDE